MFIIKRISIIIITISLVFSFITLNFIGCISTTSPASILTRSYKMGIVPMPKSFSSEDISAAYVLSKSAGEVISLSQKLGWDSNNELDKYQNDVTLAQANNLEVFISVDVLTDDRTGIGNLPIGWESYDFSNTDLRNAFKTEVKNILTTYSPKYLILALEINAYGNDVQFNNFVTLYLETYNELRTLDSNVIIGVSFQYENILINANWNRISSFGTKLDRTCFTTYPTIIGYSDVNTIPSNYYSPLENYQNVVFTEIGWTGGNTVDGEAEQSRFIEKFFTLTSSVDMDLAIWSLLHDWTGGGFFEYMGLIGVDGIKKPAWKEWTMRKVL